MFILIACPHLTVTFDPTGGALLLRTSRGCGSMTAESSGNECFISLCKENNNNNSQSIVDGGREVSKFNLSSAAKSNKIIINLFMVVSFQGGIFLSLSIEQYISPDIWNKSHQSPDDLQSACNVNTFHTLGGSHTYNDHAWLVVSDIYRLVVLCLRVIIVPMSATAGEKDSTDAWSIFRWLRRGRAAYPTHKRERGRRW